MDRQTSGLTDTQTDRWADGQMDRKTNGQMHGSINGWPGRQVDRRQIDSREDRYEVCRKKARFVFTKHEQDCQSRANEWDGTGQNVLITEISGMRLF